jgi:hypothetical protein
MIDHGLLLIRVVEKLFPEKAERDRITRILNRYGGSKFQSESARVKLGILKLAGKSPELIQYYTMQACRDYRDILTAAEYPNQFKNPFLRKNDPAGYARLVEEDRKQYTNWYLRILWGRDQNNGV